MCIYCDKDYIENKTDVFSGGEGIYYDKQKDRYYIVIEHFRNEVNMTEIQYCFWCGRKLQDNCKVSPYAETDWKNVKWVKFSELK